MYVEPVYVRGTQDESFPLLRRVLVGFDNEVAFEPTLEEALDVLFQGARPGDITGPDGQTIEQEPPSGGQQPEPTESPAPGDGGPTTPGAGPGPGRPARRAGAGHGGPGAGVQRQPGRPARRGLRGVRRGAGPSGRRHLAGAGGGGRPRGPDGAGGGASAGGAAERAPGHAARPCRLGGTTRGGAVR